MQNIKLLGLLGEALLGKFPKTKRATPKPKQLSANPLRGYYANHTGGLTEYFTEQRNANIANGKTGFKGFRKVRKFIEVNNMSVWVKTS